MEVRRSVAGAREGVAPDLLVLSTEMVAARKDVEVSPPVPPIEVVGS